MKYRFLRSLQQGILRKPISLGKATHRTFFVIIQGHANKYNSIEYSMKLCIDFITYLFTKFITNTYVL